MADKTDREKLIEELRAEIARMPNPDEPFFGVDRKAYSPNDLLKEIEEGTISDQVLEAWIELRK